MIKLELCRNKQSTTKKNNLKGTLKNSNKMINKQFKLIITQLIL